MILKFGKYKDKDTSQIPSEYLLWLIENTDINDAKYGAKNQELVNACHAAMNSNTDKQIAKPAPRAFKAPVKSIATSKKMHDIVQEFQAYIQNIYQATQAMQELIDVYHEDGSVTQDSQHTPF